MDIKDVSSTLHAGEVALPASSVPSAGSQTRRWHYVCLGLIVLLSAFLNFFMLQLKGYGNKYYAAAIRSMLESWHNFFFVSFDPGGFVTVDKPPLGLWIQAVSAKLLGFSGFSITLPQALAGIASVLLLYYLVRRNFGPVAGLLAALFLAITPVNVVMNRNNNLDTQLVLAMLLSAWAIMRATESGRLRWLLLGVLFLGLGFNIKTLEAYLALPALGLLYLLGAPVRWRTRILHLMLAALALLVISFSWITIVDLTPVSQRPYVGSSQTNSELELTLGYNGIDRLIGGIFGGHRRGEGVRDIAPGSTASPSSTQAPPNWPPPGPPPGSGSPSPTRLFTVNLGSQVSWLLPLAMVALFALGWQSRFRIPLTRPHRDLVLWGMWLLTMGVFFSVAGFFQPHYLVVLAPAICALSAIGLVLLWRDYRERSMRDWRSWGLIVALALTAAEQIFLLSSYQSLGRILSILVGLLCLLAVIVLIVARLPVTRSDAPVQRRQLQRVQFPAISVALLALLLTPLIWSFISTTQPENTTILTAGPPLASRFRAGREGDFNHAAGGFDGGGFGFGSGSVQTNTKLINYLEVHNGNTRYLLAVSSAMSASDIIIQTGKPVMTLGGFMGRDPILTQQQLINLIHNGTVRFFLIRGNTPFNSNLTNWVTSHCTVVPKSQWQATSQNSGSSSGNGNASAPANGGPGGGGGAGGIRGNQQLYDCSATH